MGSGIVKVLIGRPRAATAVALVVAGLGVMFAGLLGGLSEAGSNGGVLVTAICVLVVCVVLAVEVFRSVGVGTLQGGDARHERAAGYVRDHPAFAVLTGAALVVLVIALVGLLFGVTGPGLAAASGGALVAAVSGLAGLRNAIARSG